MGGGAQGYSLYDKIFILHLQFDEHLYIDVDLEGESNSEGAEPEPPWL